MEENFSEQRFSFGEIAIPAITVGTAAVMFAFLAADFRLGERPWFEEGPSVVTPPGFETNSTQPLVITNEDLPDPNPRPATRVGEVLATEP